MRREVELIVQLQRSRSSTYLIEMEQREACFHTNKEKREVVLICCIVSMYVHVSDHAMRNFCESTNVLSVVVVVVAF